uniref:Nuclear pore complex protein NUP205 n=1 Tax=Gossypium raimondii TaxID=29730 RepID=A0A0D2PLL5_GOSRA|nr:hypothetical protein B456_001G042000 [Gossypium raimondii]
MVTPKQLLSIIESSVVNPFPPSPAQRIELLHAIRTLLPSLKSLLSYPPPRPSDRAQVRSKELRLPDSPPISLDDQDVQIALKLSDELYLNEIDCVQLLVSANQEWGLVGRGPLEILRLAAGLWYSERRDIVMALYTLLRAAVIDPGLEAGLVADIQKYLEDLINAGLRQRLISLIKELNREEPAGLGGPLSEHYLLDSRGALVERRAVVCRERLLLGHCLVLSVLVVRTGPKDVKDVFSVLKDSAAELSESSDTLKHQACHFLYNFLWKRFSFYITHSLLFFLVIAFVSDALSALSDKSSILSHDASFRKEFQDTVMAVVNDPNSEGFVGGVRLAWVVHLMLIHDEIGLGEAVSTVSSNEFGYINFCLESVFAKNVFHFLLEKVLRSAAYQNDDEDMVYMYNAYLHKLITCFLSHPVARDKVKESKEKAMITLNTYRMAGDFVHDSSMQGEQAAEGVPLPFVSLLEFKEPELLSGNDVLWTFVNFAGEDHTNFQTLVAFLNMLSTLASSQEGASKVYELLQGKAFRSIGWSTLFNCLSIYDEKYKQSLQTAGAMLPEFQEGDAKALVAYLNVLQKVVQNGNPIERKNWFPDIEPLFKLLSYENVPTYLKGALRNTIATFVRVSPVLKDTIWTFLEQYDLPVVVGSQVGISGQPMAAQVYDMQFELNEIEARREQYPSTISFLNLLNALIAEEKDVSDRGRRAYADPSEKWQLVVACLQHFHMILRMYDIQEQDLDSVIDRSQLSAVTQPSSLQMQLPILELLKDFMSGKTVFRNIMSILMPGVNTIIAERNSQVYGPLLEKAVQLSLEIVILVLEKDILLADFWRPLYQPLDVVLSQDHNQIVALLEYVRYEFLPQIQQSSIKIMSILSSRMVGLVQLLLKSNVATSLVEDYASCLEFRSQECQVIENSRDDPGILIMQLLIDNVSRPAPNITHLLLKFDLDTSIERTLLQPKFHFSCLKVILEILENLSKPDVNAWLHEFGFQLLYELCLDPLTCGPTLDLLSNKKYHFFVKHLDSVGVAPLPKRNSNQALRISSLHQRAWLLKLLAVELHAAYMSSPHHREACQSILAHLFGQDVVETGTDVITQSLILQNNKEHTATRTISKTKVSELLEVVQFRSPDTTMNLSQIISNMKYNLLVEDILRNPSTSGKGGIYYYSERGDRLIDLASLRDKLWQKFNSVYPQLSNFGNEAELNEVRETIQQLLRWGWRYNKNLEEQAAQLHMLTGWSHIVEVSVSRRISSLENRSEILYQILDACLGASASPDCSLKMAFILSQVALTCMAKLRDDRFLFPGGFSSDNITCLDIIMVKQLSNGACHSLLFKLIMTILRNESSEALRRRQYALLLSYFQYCQHMLVPNVPTSVLQQLLLDEQDGEELDLQKIDKEQAELARANFSVLRKEAQAILDLVIKDATHGSEPGKTISLYVLDAVVCIDHQRYFLSQLQSRGFLRSCLMSISSFSSADGGHSLDSMQRACTLEAELALLLRICHKYGKSGAQVLFSMGALEHIASCRAVNLQGSLRVETKLRRDVAVDVDKQRMIVTPVLRVVFSLTSLVDTSEFFEVKNKIVREVIDFVKGHHLVFDHILREDVSGADDLMMEQINLVVGILSKVWPYEESGEYGFVQGLFSMMHILFSCDSDRPFLSISTRSPENQRKSELSVFQLCFSLSSYLYFLVTKKSLRLQVSDDSPEYHSPVSLQQPTLNLLCSLLNGVINSLERAADEKSLLLNKIRDINELSRQEVDEVINMCIRQDLVSASDDIQKRRYIAMVEMCQVAGNRDQLISLLLPLVEHVLNVIIIHFQDSSGVFNTNGSMKTITYGAEPDSGQEISLLCGKLIPLLERLELLSEEKVGHNLKVFRRSVASLKEMAIQKFAG